MAHTIDGFQGREADVILFTTVRSNAERDIGFLDDPRRVNVAWTRAKCARIVIGDREMLRDASELWRAAIADATEVFLPIQA